MRKWTLVLMLVAGVAWVGCKKDGEAGGGGEGSESQALKKKTVEAIDLLDKIYKGAAMYFTAPKVSRTGELLAAQFPATTACVPASNPCDKANKRFAPDPSAWNSDTWSALMFAVSDPHYFRYCFTSSGTMGEATFTASAHADLDCDGTWSTFQRMGMADAENCTRAECSMKSGAALYVENELE